LVRVLMFVEELRRTFTRPRNLVILGLIGLVPILLGVVVKTLGVGHGSGGPPFFSQITDNPVFLVLVALTTMQTFLLPLLIGLVAGDSVAGEAASGSLRYLVAAPAGRVRIILVKTLVVMIFTIAAALVIAITGGVTGSLLFHVGKIVTLSGSVVSNTRGVVLTVEAALTVGVSMFSVVGVGLFVSTLTDTPAAASAVAVGVAIISEILGGIPQLIHVQPILLSTYWGSFTDLMRTPQVLHGVGRDFLESFGWLAVTVIAGAVNFAKKDLLS
jgi:ABC-2 type transport system permease protein